MGIRTKKELPQSFSSEFEANNEESADPRPSKQLLFDFCRSIFIERNLHGCKILRFKSEWLNYYSFEQNKIMRILLILTILWFRIFVVPNSSNILWITVDIMSPFSDGTEIPMQLLQTLTNWYLKVSNSQMLFLPLSLLSIAILSDTGSTSEYGYPACVRVSPPSSSLIVSCGKMATPQTM